MLESGIDTDIQSNRPLAEKVKQKEAEATIKYRRAVLEALDLASELQGGSPVLAILAKQYKARLAALAENDPECQSIEKLIYAMRVQLELRPRLAEERMIQVVGPQLVHFTENEVAPEGDTGSE